MSSKKYIYYGIISGFVAAIFEAIMFYIFDFIVFLPPGYQFTAIGERVLGISGSYGTLYGILLHFLVGTVVGMFAAIISYYVIALRIKNMGTGIGIGILAGFLILILFSLPVNIFLLHLYVYEKYYLPSTFFYYTMHVFFGAVWGIFLGYFITHGRHNN
ncbi:hypothetical protein [Ferroplasma sp.]|uniref:hypothetical protein n=1 Tax=Ferroplasma sp. TaxID=2591003 RepID=UPI00307CF357